jgi:RNA-binding protein 25
LITPAGKPQGFGFCDFQDPDGALRALELLNGVELPALEDGCVSKKLLVSTIAGLVVLHCLSLPQVKVDEKNKMFLDAYQAQKMKTDVRFNYGYQDTR